ncbi:MAG: hypothetical protein Q8N47_13590 [Bryobacterales bacterium]|nr:hypothetical protein [Bryobacterales bacterium]
MAKPTKRASAKRNGDAPKNQAKVPELGLELDRLRARYVAGGGKLLNRRELEREIAERRGLR